jgi:hypothetical protein
MIKLSLDKVLWMKIKKLIKMKKFESTTEKDEDC